MERERKKSKKKKEEKTRMTSMQIESLLGLAACVTLSSTMSHSVTVRLLCVLTEVQLALTPWGAIWVDYFLRLFFHDHDE